MGPRVPARHCRARPCLCQLLPPPAVSQNKCDLLMNKDLTGHSHLGSRSFTPSHLLLLVPVQARCTGALARL